MTETVTRLAPRRVFRKILIVAISVALLPAGLAAWVYLLHDWSNKPLCNKQTFFQVMNWIDDKKATDLPNVHGSSVESLRQLKQDAYDSKDEAEASITEWNGKYQYVPGLQRGDPNDLVLMYMKQPTRWQHHATSPPSIFRESKWILVPLDFVGPGESYCAEHQKRTVADEGECAERVPVDELKSRLRKTLDYLEKNNRPNWQTVVAENEEFPKTLERK